MYIISLKENIFLLDKLFPALSSRVPDEMEEIPLSETLSSSSAKYKYYTYLAIWSVILLTKIDWSPDIIWGIVCEETKKTDDIFGFL